MILAGGNDYMIAVKNNQKALLESIMSTIADVAASASYERLEHIKGRTEHRECLLWHDCSRIPPGWSGVKSIICLRSSGTRSNKPYQEHRYYISSLALTDAAKAAGYIRQHWQIENNLHRALDVVFHEDSTKLPSNDVQKKFAIFRRIGVNIFRMHGFKGLKYPVATFSNKVPQLFTFATLRT